MIRRAWTQLEVDTVRRLYSTHSAAAIGKLLGRPAHSVYNQAFALGLKKLVHADTGPALHAFLRSKHALGWSDAEIADAWSKLQGAPLGRKTLCDHRRKLGLPNNAFSDRRRRAVAAKTREQLAKAGLKSLAEVRVVAYRDRAVKAGWPADLRPRAVQILNVLWDRGPMTRRELADAIGMPWKGSRKSLVSNDPEGSYLAHLIKRGLVISLGRVAQVLGQGRGKSRQVYSLNMWVERRKG